MKKLKKFKVGDKVVFNAEGKRSYAYNYHHYHLNHKGVFGVVKTVSPAPFTKNLEKLGNLLAVEWFNRKNSIPPYWTDSQFWSCYFKSYNEKPKAYNHPLTPIFAEKMPKTRLTRKKKCGIV